MKIDFTKIQNHVAARWVNGCPMCRGRNWSIHNILEAYVPINIQTDSVEYGSQDVFPVALVKCQECGLVLQVSPLLIGALESE